MKSVKFRNLQKDFEQWEKKIHRRKCKAIKGISLYDSGIAN